MATLGSITLPAKKLQEAVSIAVPSELKRAWRKKAWPLNLSYDKKKEFRVVEARHELAGFDITVSGKWPTTIQVNGAQFRRVIETYKPNEILTLTVFPDHLEIAGERSPFKMPRLDAPGKESVSTTPIKPNKRHKGKIHVEEYVPTGRVELDATWDFSARMPVPHHQYPDSVLPTNGSPPNKKFDSVLPDQDGAKLVRANTPLVGDNPSGGAQYANEQSDLDKFRRIAKEEIDGVLRAFEPLRPGEAEKR